MSNTKVNFSKLSRKSQDRILELLFTKYFYSIEGMKQLQGKYRHSFVKKGLELFKKFMKDEFFKWVEDIDMSLNDLYYLVEKEVLHFFWVEDLDEFYYFKINTITLEEYLDAIKRNDKKVIMSHINNDDIYDISFEYNYAIWYVPKNILG